MLRQNSSDGVLQRDLAQALRVSTRQIRRIEAGEFDIRASRLRIIADTLGVSIDALYAHKPRAGG